MLTDATIHLYHQTLAVQVAQTHADHVQGLSDRPSLKPYQGMLFVFKKPGYHAMVMRRMHFPIDVVWFLNRHVVDSKQNLQPEPGIPESKLTIYKPKSPADGFLELAAGELAAMRQRAKLVQ